MEQNKTLNLYVLTHCESCYNKRGIFTGRINSVLTKRGHEHAKKLSEKLRNEMINIAYTSPLSRARQTLSHILKYHPETKVVVDRGIIERDYGELSRKSKEKFRKKNPKLYPFYHRSYDVPPPGGESMEQVDERVLYFIRKVVKKMKKEGVNVLVVAHGNSIRPIRRYFEKLSPEQMMKLKNIRHKIFRYQISS